MTGDQDSVSGGRPTAIYGVVAALAALAGFAAVYVSLPQGGNDTEGTAPSSSAAPVDENSAKAAKSAPASLSKIGLRAYAKGQMATFVAKKKPVTLPALRFKDGAGTARSMDDWKGKVILLNLWATWCAPCRKEMPEFVKLKKALAGPDFDIVAISIDSGGPEKPLKFLKDIKAESLGFYQGKMSETAGPLKVFGMPTTLLLDREGREIGRMVGPADWSSDDAVALIKAAVAGTS